MNERFQKWTAWIACAALIMICGTSVAFAAPANPIQQGPQASQANVTPREEGQGSSVSNPSTPSTEPPLLRPLLILPAALPRIPFLLKAIRRRKTNLTRLLHLLKVIPEGMEQRRAPILLPRIQILSPPLIIGTQVPQPPIGGPAGIPYLFPAPRRRALARFPRRNPPVKNLPAPSVCRM